jgi:peptidoglycan L-alanyl-D-glutamate endopeptidase CwlK
MAEPLGRASRARLVGVHPDLVRLVERCVALNDVGIVVLEGLRTPARQAELLAAGATRTLRSRHLTGHAVDLGATLGHEVRWDWPLYHRIASAMKAASAELGVPVEWGGDWRTFKDGPHWQLPWESYPPGRS